MKNKKIPCPNCNKMCDWNKNLNPFRPFCGERCKLIDLGNWAEGKNRMPGENIDFTINDKNFEDKE